MPLVYAGKYLRIDLTDGTITEHPIAEEDVRRFLLGSGYAAYRFYQEVDPALSWDDASMPVYVFNGLLSGTFAPTGCRSSWCTRSPLTGIWGESNVGGHWGAELRFAGYDGLVITGRAAQPVYLWIDGRSGRVSLRPADHLWGRNHYEVAAALVAETDAKAQVACIGLAGENGVRYAGVMTGGIEHARTAGRTGVGAVLGHKRLKAIVVRGREKPAYADAGAFRETVKAANAAIKDHSFGLSLLGTAGGVINSEAYGDLPLRNWRDGTWPDAALISGQRIAETIFRRHTFCFACPIGCGKTVQIDQGPYAGTRGHGPEYETLAGFGGMLLNNDLESIAHINMLCNDYGLDTISTSACIAFAIEAVERGLLAPIRLDGHELSWGNAPAIVACVHHIARREGIGAFLAEGVRAMAAALGPEATPLALHVKGLEIPYHDPRAFVSMAANYATANRGACHMEAITYWEGYGIEVPGLVFHPGVDHFRDRLDSRDGGRMAVHYQNYQSVYNPLGLCRFIVKGLAGPQLVADLVNTALGWDWTPATVFLTGERIFNLKRLINLRYGITAADDTLPARFLSEPRPDGGAAGNLPDLSAMLAEYYEARGWDPVTGAPTPARLQALGLA
jgi:aldehyde:ferredoxin oxidoreductase